MKKRIIYIIATVLVLALVFTACASCNNGSGFTVTFDLQNGDKSIIVEFGKNFSLPKDPTRELWKFDGWYADPDCTERWTVPDQLTQDITVYAKWKFIHDFGDEYLMWDAECLDDGCTAVGRNPSTNQAKKKFVYNFNADRKSEVDNAYNAVVANIANGNDFDAFKNLYEQYDAKISYVAEQYQISYVFYCTYDDAQYEERYNYATEAYNENVSRYYKLFRDVYNSAYKDVFFKGWSTEDINYALAQADSYGNSQYTEIKNQVDALVLEYNSLMDANAPVSQIAEKYAELVNLNNDLAEIAGYDNYADYAYGNVYGREYTPADVATMRNYVKRYIAPKLDELIKPLQEFKGFTNLNSQSYYLAMATESVFTPKNSAKPYVNLMGKYFKEMTQNGNDKDIDFYNVANDIFKNGNYYLGRHDGAYTYWIDAQQTSILYFSNQKDAYGFYTYQNVFTFVHEFGHYFNGYYNGALDISMDHNETQSQGDEMMFLAWLGNNIPNGCSEGYEIFAKEKLANMLSTICIATAVDEFEQAAYTGTYNGQTVKADNYHSVFSQILATYGKTMSEQTDYWTYVVFEQPAYYVSYAMSALPCVELYTMARGNFGAAKQTYFKLFTFSDDETCVAPDGTVLKNYSEILKYCGLNNPFEEQLYTTIYNNLV